MNKKIIFVTGTDTGVGKTVFTAMLLEHLRQSGVHALAMKPFCSGGRGDVRLLQSLQKGELSDDKMNPFYFKAPVAPLIAAKQEKKVIQLRDVLRKIEAVEKRCECLLIEGVGGLLVPLGKNFTVADIIRELKCTVVVVARNKLGTINHTCLTVMALKSLGDFPIKVVLMEQGRKDYSARSNSMALAEVLGQMQLENIPFLGKNPSQLRQVKANGKRLRSTFAKLVHRAET